MRKKISPRRIREIKDKKERKATFAAIKKPLSDMGRSFSEGTDKVADILLEDSQRAKTTKPKRVKEEASNVVEDIASGVKKILKNLRTKDALRDASYEIGRLSRIAKDTCSEILNNLMK